MESPTTATTYTRMICGSKREYFKLIECHHAIIQSIRWRFRDLSLPNITLHHHTLIQGEFARRGINFIDNWEDMLDNMLACFRNMHTLPGKFLILDHNLRTLGDMMDLLDVALEIAQLSKFNTDEQAEATDDNQEGLEFSLGAEVLNDTDAGADADDEWESESCGSCCSDLMTFESDTESEEEGFHFGLHCRSSSLLSSDSDTDSEEGDYLQSWDDDSELVQSLLLEEAGGLPSWIY